LLEAEERVEVRGVGQDLKPGVEEVKETVEAGIENVTKIPKVKQVGVQETNEYWENVGQGSASGASTVVDEAEKIRSAPSTPMQPVVESGGCFGMFRRRGSGRKCVIL
jgi:hypothetical protein